MPLNCSFGIVTERREIGPRTVRSICQLSWKQWDADVTIIFAVRRAGCGACREHALQLNDIVSQLKNESIDEEASLRSDAPSVEPLLRTRQVELVGVVKETGVDDDALLDFYEKYFMKHQLYKDSKWQIYNAMGPRKLSVARLLTQTARLARRYRKKNIVNVPFGGDIFTQGGVLIFDKEGVLRYAYLERYGDKLPEEEIKAAVRAAGRAFEP
jgi:AhpC/TSA antioxidant enzyme